MPPSLSPKLNGISLATMASSPRVDDDHDYDYHTPFEAHSPSPELDGLDDPYPTPEDMSSPITTDVLDQWPNRKYYPDEYAPLNPNCRTIVSSMRKVTKRWLKLGRDLSELWDEESPHGIMVKAIRLGHSNILNQTTFLRVRPLLQAIEANANPNNRDTIPTKEPKSKPIKRQRTEEDEAESDDSPRRKHNKSSHRDAICTPSFSRYSNGETSLDQQTEATTSNHMSHKLITIPANRTSIVHLASTSTTSGINDVPGVSTTIQRLRAGEMLLSRDIFLCVQTLNPPSDWCIFDPGFPFPNGHSPRHNRKRLPRHLVFFCNHEKNWSLCYIDTTTHILYHYNSCMALEMPTGRVKKWLETKSGINFGDPINVIERDCPQQEDSTNCGIFALVCLESLIHGRATPGMVNSELMRGSFADQIDETIIASENVTTSSSSPRPVSPEQSSITVDTSDLPTYSTPEARSSRSQVAKEPFGSERPPRTKSLQIDGSHLLRRSSLPPTRERQIPMDPKQPPESPLDISANGMTSTFAARSHLGAFLSQFKKAKIETDRLQRQLDKVLAKIQDQNSQLSLHRQQLQEQEQLERHLSEQIMEPDKKMELDDSIQEWLNSCPRASHPFGEQWLGTILAQASSAVEAMIVDGDSIAQQITGAKEACKFHQGQIARLTGEIEQGNDRKQDLEKRVETNKAELAEMKHVCADVLQ
ncbi:hypothetical protein FSARC_6122 [Fusarium sarcochroum]|uniref:Ubiquitin-like protease family profile domain-containing protein n=1 Tax=Fusarium sarcochroum TaxID=1208366 RepID=A0A8H4TXW6_9HYPO|nr:hypothetical protein FSARC_6122 [Fusarium sarcochroum]